MCFWPVYPGMTYPRLREGTKAVLLQGYHSGTLPTGVRAFQDFAKSAQMQGIPVFLCGSPAGGLDEDKEHGAGGVEYYEKEAHYESTALFDALHIAVLPCAAPIAMYMKLWLLAGKDNLQEKMGESLGGDIYSHSPADR